MIKKLLLSLVILCAAGFAIYTAGWFWWAAQVERQIETFRADMTAQGTIIDGTFTPVSGFPGALVTGFSGRISSGMQSLTIPAATVESYFLPGAHIRIDMPQGAHAQVPEWASFASTIDAIHIDAVIPRPLPAAFTAGALHRWKESGGRLVINDLSLQKGPLFVRGTGAITLDDRLQPAGQLDAEITGHAAFVMELQNQNLIETKEALIAGTILNGLSRQEESGQTILPITLKLQNSTLYAGPLAILPLPPMIWPE